jgi:hypothetical protein
MHKSEFEILAIGLLRYVVIAMKGLKLIKVLFCFLLATMVLNPVAPIERSTVDQTVMGKTEKIKPKKYVCKKDY